MLKGSYVALITPFKENGDLDLEALEKLVEWQIESGTDGIICCGTTGEDPTLSDEDCKVVIKTVVKTARKRVTVIAGTGTCATHSTVERTREASRLGVDGVLVIVPYYSRPTFEGCLAHYTEVGKVGTPTIIYYNPARTGCRLTAAQIGAISHLPSMAGIKDSSGTTDLIEELKTHTQLPIMSGDDVVAFEHLKRGASGVISIIANVIPTEWKEMIDLSLKGDFAGAQVIFEKCLPLCQSVVIEPNPQGIKYAAHVLGKCRPDLRLPLVQPRESTKLIIETALRSAFSNAPLLTPSA